MKEEQNIHLSIWSFTVNGPKPGVSVIRLSVIVRVTKPSCFDNLTGSHLRGQIKRVLKVWSVLESLDSI